MVRTFFQTNQSIKCPIFISSQCPIEPFSFSLFGGRIIIYRFCNNWLSIDNLLTAILGNTVEKIAAEKAGIIKPGAPVVIFDMAMRRLITSRRIRSS